jgi:hypothetical protein
MVNPTVGGGTMCQTVGRLTLLVLFIGATALHAQDTTEIAERPPTFSTGVAAGAIQFAGGRAEQAASLVLQLQPVAWFSFSAAPGYGRTSFGTRSGTGLTEIPIRAGALYNLNDVPWSPTVSASLETSLSGDSALAFSAGQHDYEAEATLSGSPTDRLNLLLALTHALSANSGNPSVRVESAFSLGRATATLGMTSEMGRPDSGAVLSRSIAGGLAFSLVGPLTLTTDASHGISGSAPTWTLSVGLGSAFAGISPLNPTSALKRLKQTFGSKVSASSGYTRTSGSSNSCRKNGTC